jgi:predicted HD phosphohydrolase
LDRYVARMNSSPSLKSTIEIDVALDRILGLLQADRSNHGLQCAAILKKHFPDDVELQLAGLFHDTGHTLADECDHGRTGAAIVRPVLGDRVADLIELHVPAKRYLVTRFPGYHEILAADSVATLKLQGSEMSDAEIVEYDSHPLAIDALSLRLADDRAKNPAAIVPAIDAWMPVIVDQQRRVRNIRRSNERELVLAGARGSR